jgi:hypothetical protein
MEWRLLVYPIAKELSRAMRTVTRAAKRRRAWAEAQRRSFDGPE